MHVPSTTAVAVFRAGVGERSTILAFTLPDDEQDGAFDEFLGVRAPLFGGGVERLEQTGTGTSALFRPCKPSHELIEYVREIDPDVLGAFSRPGDAQLTVAVLRMPRCSSTGHGRSTFLTVRSPAPTDNDTQLPLPSFAPS